MKLSNILNCSRLFEDYRIIQQLKFRMHSPDVSGLNTPRLRHSSQFTSRFCSKHTATTPTLFNYNNNQVGKVQTHAIYSFLHYSSINAPRGLHSSALSYLWKIQDNKDSLLQFGQHQRISRMGCSTSKVDVSKNGANNCKKSGTVAEEYIQEAVCQDDEIGENEMKAFQMGEVGKVLVVRQNGVLTAIGSKCTHYGAPLETGALTNGRVRCPWHGACFNIKTGDIEDFPGLDSLPCFQVQVINDQVVVRAKRTDLKSSKRVKQMTTFDESDRGQYVIIGGGPSGNSCAETLRQNGYSGKITILCKEKYFPYDRVKISKILDIEISQIQLRDEDFYEQNHIDVYKSSIASSIDIAARKIFLSDGSIVPYSKVYIATGSTALRPKIPGVDLHNIFTLRTYEDAQAIHQILNNEKDVVVLGASFIAMEAAAYCQGKAKSVTIVGRDEYPFQKLFGEEIGAAVKKLFESKGVKFFMKSGITEFQGEINSVKKAVLVAGEPIPADIVILGTGSTLNTEFLKNSEIKMDTNGAIEVNEFLQTNIPNVFAGGDIANAPVFSANNIKSTIGHYGLAQYHGRIAGLNMSGKQTCQETVPFFWTMLFGIGIRYCGQGPFDEILYSGDVANLKYAAYFLKDGVVTAVSTCGMPGAAEFANRLASGKKLLRQDLGDNYSAWMSDKEKTSL